MANKDKMERRSRTSFLCLIVTIGLGVLTFSYIPAYAKKEANKVKNKSTITVEPDFAFPKTVERNAGIQLQEALIKHNYAGALKAAIQMNVASGLISAENYPASLNRYDSLARVLPAPWSNLALLLEARLYCDIYSDKPWIFNNRQLPLTPRPQSVLEWSTPMFSTVVSELCQKALEQGELLSSIPIARISGLLEKSMEAEKRGFSVYDFISQQAVGMLERFASQVEEPILPLIAGGVNNSAKADGERPKDNITVNSVIDAAIECSASEGNLFKEAYWTGTKLRRMPDAQKMEYAEKCMERFGDTPYCSEFVCIYCDLLAGNNEGRRKQLKVLEEYIARFPDAEGINAVKNKASELQHQEVNVSFSSQLLPGVPNKVSVSGENLYEYYLLAVSLPEKSDKDSYRYSDLIGRKVVASVPVKVSGTVPDTYNDTIHFPALTPGVYALVPSRSSNIDGVLIAEKRSYLNVVNVSDISTFTVNAEDGKNYFYVVSGLNGKPIANANVVFYRYKNGVKVKDGSYVTDAAGRFEFKPGMYDYVVTSGNSTLFGSVYGGNIARQEETRIYRGSLFTDLSVYRPGNKVQFAGVVYTQQGKQLRASSEKEMSVVLRDANWISLDTIQVKSDKFGRFDAEFQIPESGLAGTWGLTMMDGKTQIGSVHFQVAEYKAPTFITEISSASESYRPGDKLIFRGYAKTYSGMPVAGAKATYTISRLPVWWRYSGVEASFGGQTQTGSDGSFEIILDTKALKGTPYEKGLYQISGDVTDAAGETQAFPSLRFSMGSAYSINASIPDAIRKESTPEVLKVGVNDIAGRPVKKQVYYEISTSDGKTIAKGEFESPTFTPEFKDFPSGRYEIKFSLSPDMAENDDNPVTTAFVILWSKADQRPPVNTCLWVPEKRIIAPAGSKSIDVSVGSSIKDGYVLGIISDTKKYLSSDWYRITEGIIKVTLDSPSDDERIFINFIAEANLDMKQEKVEVIPSSQTESVKIKVQTFRDRIEPGTEEKWTFSLNLSDKPLPNTPVMAVMTDKAINAITQFNWSFNPYGSLRWFSPVGITLQYRYGGSNNYYSPIKYLNNSVGFTLPGFNTYGYSLYSGSRNYGVMNNQTTRLSGVKVRGTRKLAAGASADKLESVTMDSDEVVVETESAADAPAVFAASAVVNELKEEAITDFAPEVEIRDSECPLAFFKPGLETDEDGVATVEFIAPLFVGTWQLQLLGFTPDMRGATYSIDAVSSKSVMANLNAPRFVRTGDVVSVAASLYNNTENSLPIEGTLSILDAETGKVLTSREFTPIEVEAAGSRTIMMDFKIPTDVEMLTMRVVANSSGHSDGEQSLVPVLAATAVVRESTAFYMSPTEEEITVKLPKYDSEASVTLNYCGNPTWECLTALPALTTPDSRSILVLADALFGNAIASGLLHKYPALLDGLSAMAAPANTSDSALYSPLQKNTDLKEILLSNTPWVNAAAAETLRMQSLLKYADKGQSEDAVNGAVKLLTDRQNKDGGWSWCPDMRSSDYMTSRVLGVLAGLRNLGYLPKGAESLAHKAFNYMDKAIAEQWIKADRKYYSLSELVNYLYAKTAFEGLGNAGAFGALEKVVMKDLEKEWRELSLFDKATAAMVLERKGNSRTARNILESIRQFSSETIEKGMWFDNLTDVWNSSGPLLTTARVLEAFALIEPQNPAIDKLRQWIVLSKQTEDWSASGNATEAICAILSSGSDWSVPATMPGITIGGNPVNLPRGAALTGAFTLNLDASKASDAVLKIEKSNLTPAWGGVVARYVSPIEKTKAISMSQLEVKKALNVVTSGAEGVSVSSGNLKVGDKVRITITLTCDRDLDYVAVVDNRAACLEPADQLSAYTSSGGVWYYREVKDTKTTLFIPSLSKGTHVISYDCYADRAGEYSFGITMAQSQYAPLITASSAGEIIKVEQ